LLNCAGPHDPGVEGGGGEASCRGVRESCCGGAAAACASLSVELTVDLILWITQADNQRLRRQLHEMETFLNDYGLVWVGDEGQVPNPDIAFADRVQTRTAELVVGDRVPCGPKRVAAAHCGAQCHGRYGFTVLLHLINAGFSLGACAVFLCYNVEADAAKLVAKHGAVYQLKVSSSILCVWLF